MHLLCATRFNSDTFLENYRWRNSRNYNGCIYNTPIKISSKILEDTILFVLEMNNTTNKIEAIGIIKNKCTTFSQNKSHKIYSEQNYNRYTYKGKYRISRKEMTQEEEKIFNILDILLFKGSSHFKRGQGIQLIPLWIIKNNQFNFTEFCTNLFKSHFIDNNIISTEKKK